MARKVNKENERTEKKEEIDRYKEKRKRDTVRNRERKKINI